MSQINVRNLSNENGDGAPDIVGVSTFSATSYIVPPVGTTAQRPKNPQPGDLRFNTDTASLEYYRGDTIGWSQFELIDPELGGGTGSNTGLGTRGLFAGGLSPSLSDVIDFLTISTLGDTQDFGDIVANSGSGIQGAGSCSSTTRGITFGGGTGPSTVNEMNYITIGTLGNSVDFGDLSAANYLCQGVSNGTRGVVAGGDNLSGANNRIEYITIASTGDTTDFGDLSSISEFAGATGGSNKIRGVFVGRGDWTAVDNAMSYITIATTGNAQDFGDIRTPLQNYGSNALSDSHGGL